MGILFQTHCQMLSLLEGKLDRQRRKHARSLSEGTREQVCDVPDFFFVVPPPRASPPHPSAPLTPYHAITPDHAPDSNIMMNTHNMMYMYMCTSSVH